MPHHFAPLGLFMSRSIFPRAMPWAFTFQAFGPSLSLYDSKEQLLAESVIMAQHGMLKVVFMLFLVWIRQSGTSHAPGDRSTFRSIIPRGAWQLRIPRGMTCVSFDVDLQRASETGDRGQSRFSELRPECQNGYCSARNGSNKCLTSSFNPSMFDVRMNRTVRVPPPLFCAHGSTTE